MEISLLNILLLCVGIFIGGLIPPFLIWISVELWHLTPFYKKREKAYWDDLRKREDEKSLYAIMENNNVYEINQRTGVSKLVKKVSEDVTQWNPKELYLLNPNIWGVDQ